MKVLDRRHMFLLSIVHPSIPLIYPSVLFPDEPNSDLVFSNVLSECSDVLIKTLKLKEKANKQANWSLEHIFYIYKRWTHGQCLHWTGEVRWD